MLQSEYWISELAALAGVSTRTIRYYIQEGLLPQPEIRGKYAVFTDEYMHRLRLIKHLKDAYLPLNRIRELLSLLDDRRVINLLQEFDRDPARALASLPVQAREKEQREPSNRDEDALTYIRDLRSGKRIAEKPVLMRQDFILQSPAAAPQESEEWRRIQLAPGLELHVRQPASQRVKRLIEQILNLLR